MRIERDLVKTVVILLGLMAILVVGGYMLNKGKADSLKKRIATAEHLLQTELADTKHIEQLVEDVEILKQAVNNERRHVRPLTDVEDLRCQIVNVFDNQDLTGHKIITKGSIPDADYNVIPIHLYFSGKFSSILSFISQIEEMERLTRIDDFECKRSLDDLKSPLVSVVRLSAFVAVPE